MLKKILVGLDGSALAEAALPYVEAFGKATGAAVVLVRAVHSAGAAEPLPDENPQLLPIMVVMPTEPVGAETKIERNERHEAERYLDHVAARLGEKGVVATAKAVAGDPRRVLLEEAEAQNADLIVVSTHGRSGLGRLIYGSVAEAVVATSPVPVLLVRATAATADRLATSPILVPLDGTPTAEKALPLAVGLAKQLATSLKLVEVVPPVTPDSYVEGILVYGNSPEIRDADRAAAYNYLTSIDQRLTKDAVDASFTVRDDLISAGIAATASDVHAGLIVLATHAESPLARALVHSVAIEVLHHASLPILLVGPKAQEREEARSKTAEVRESKPVAR
jgi:nucleotide-binding universal stress UspA family protein